MPRAAPPAPVPPGLPPAAGAVEEEEPALLPLVPPAPAPLPPVPPVLLPAADAVEADEAEEAASVPQRRQTREAPPGCRILRDEFLVDVN